MQLSCPECATKIQAKDINIHDKIAVCSNCHTVFEFNTATEKAKRRKVKQPADLTIHEEEGLTLNFRTNWRLERNQQFLMSMFGTGMALFVANATGLSYLSNNDSLILPVMALIVTMVCLYSALLTAYNHTSITMLDDKITIKRDPLPSLLNQVDTVSLHGVQTIKCEETLISKRENYDTPRYVVWAETIDGDRRTIIKDVVEEYAYFITQRLQENLDYHDDVSHLQDYQVDDDNIIYENDYQAYQNLNG